MNGVFSFGILFAIISEVCSLQCPKCNEMVNGSTTCTNSSVEDCEDSFPQQASVCLKTIQQLSPDVAWIFAQCQIREALPPGQIDKCLITDRAGVAITSCTCTSDLCDAYQPVEHGNITDITVTARTKETTSSKESIHSMDSTGTDRGTVTSKPGQSDVSLHTGGHKINSTISSVRGRNG